MHPTGGAEVPAVPPPNADRSGRFQGGDRARVGEDVHCAGSADHIEAIPVLEGRHWWPDKGGEEEPRRGGGGERRRRGEQPPERGGAAAEAAARTAAARDGPGRQCLAAPAWLAGALRLRPPCMAL